MVLPVLLLILFPPKLALISLTLQQYSIIIKYKSLYLSMAMRFVVLRPPLRRLTTLRYFNDGKGRVLGEKGHPVQNIYIKKMERERLEKAQLKAEKEQVNKLIFEAGKMQATSKQLWRCLLSFTASLPQSSNSSRPLIKTLTTYARSQPLIKSPDSSSRHVFASPWSAVQLRGAKYRGSEVKPGNVIERKGKIYQVVKANHTVQGRGGACIQVELRDVDTGNKLNERFRTDEAIERVFVEDKPYTFLYMEDDVVVLSEPNTYDQLDVPKDLFGEAVIYLKDDMQVSVQLFDGRPMSASVPQRVTCKVVEAQVPMKGIAATPHYKKVLLDNGLHVQVPAHVVTGDHVVINTADNSYMTRV